MAQHNDVEAAPAAKRYTRTDFAALRYRLNGLPLETVISKLYSEDDLAARGVAGAAELNAWLKELLAVLIERAKKANPQLAAVLEGAQRSNRWSTQVVNHLVAAGEQDYSRPRPNDTLTEWFKPVATAALKAEGIDSPGALKHYIEARGEHWYRAVPRIGAGKARTLEAWLRKNSDTMGPLVRAAAPTAQAGLVELHPNSPLLPLDRVARVATSLDGATGVNRNQTFCLISARNDLAAIQAYLLRFRDRQSTCRAYQKELERFLLWCVRHRGVAMSSVLTEECEAYKDFLRHPDPGWVGVRAARSSSAWRPFAEPLQPRSQRYSIQALRTFFDWLVRVRYLGGNPWVTVADPVVDVKEVPIDIDKALPLELWLRLVKVGGLLDRLCSDQPLAEKEGLALHGRDNAVTGAQYRLARAAIFLIGFSGIRREEATTRTRGHLKPVADQPPGSPPLWELAVLGKRKKWRTVYLPERVVDALQAHWKDRGHDFTAASELALLSPVTLVSAAARRKHVANDGLSLTGHGFTADGLYKLVKAAVIRMADDEALELTVDDRTLLRRLAPHALRHTFATQAIVTMPSDVLQKLLGHASLSTTSIYVRAERSRAISEYARYVMG